MKNNPLDYEDDSEFIASMFLDERGSRLLKIFERKFYHNIIAKPGEGTDRAFYNEGRRAVVKFVHACIRKAQNNKEK